MVLPAGRRYRRRRILVGGATLLLVGGAAYKIGTSQAQQIQQHTGKAPEELTQTELEQAMDALDIEEQELTAQDEAAIEAEAEGADTLSTPPAASPDAPARSAAQPSYLEELEKLAELKDAGIISEDEFEAKKKQLLGL